MIHEELEKMQISDSFYEDDFLQEGMNVLEKSNYIAREQTCILMDASCVLNPLSHDGNSNL